ncbi:MAG: 50S ribosomal protein L30 [Deltaproteobacteria bacterium]|nr:50S ribosomal protein L30 [Deltaproteobacteria bacterium]
MSQKTIKIQWYKGTIGRDFRQKLTIKGLGFKRLHQIIEVRDTPQVRGMIRKIPHLVKIISE